MIKLRQVQGGDFGAIIDLFDQTIDPAENCQGWHDYIALYSWAKSQGIPLSASVPPIPIDDNEDGTMALQDATDMTIPRGIFDKLYPQAYRNELDMLGDPGPSIITSYWKSARAQFGDNVDITIGTPGQTGYLTAAALAEDVRLAATLGAAELPIYTVELAAKHFGAAGVEQIITSTAPYTGAQAWWARNYVSPQALAQRGVLRALDVSATAATPLVTAANGNPQVPRTFASGPLGC